MDAWCEEWRCKLQISWCAFAAAYSYFSIVGIMYIKSTTSKKKVNPSNKWHFHSLRAAITCILAASCLASTAAGALRSTLDLVTGLMELAAVLSTTVLHILLERRRLPAPVLFIAFYWFIASWTAMATFHSLMRRLATFRHVVYNTTLIAIISYTFLFFNDSLVFWREMRKTYANTRSQEENSEDDVKQSKESSYKYNSSNFYSRITFSWMLDLLWRGYRNPLEAEDLGALPAEESSSTLYRRFRKIYLHETKEKRATVKSLSRCYGRMIFANFMIGGLFKLLGDLAGGVAPLLLAAVLRSVQENRVQFPFPEHVTFTEFCQNGYILAALIFTAACAQGTFSQNSTHLVNVEGVRLRTCLQTLIFEKCLELSSNEGASNNQSDGSSVLITNLIVQDTYSIMFFVWIAHHIWAIPLKMIFIIYLLYLSLGISALIGTICCLLLLIPLQFCVGKRMSHNSKKIAKRNDNRIAMITEIIEGIRTIKLYAWEGIFEEKILNLRELELKSLKKDSINWIIITFVTQASTILMTVMCFGLHFIIENGKMNAAQIYSSLALFNQMTVPLYIIPVTVPMIIEAMISTERIAQFLCLPEANTSESNVNRGSFNEFQNLSEENCSKQANQTFTSNFNPQQSTETPAHSNETFLKFEEAEYTWGKNGNGKEQTISIEELKIRKGKLIVVIGPRGSGKSSFLSAVLGEMRNIKGQVKWNGRPSLWYSGQKAWLIRGKIRDNIVLGGAWFPRRYSKAIAAAALRPDIRLLSDGDSTQLGENGSELSGGQRVRVCVARALYSKADVILLDEPLAALDPAAARHLLLRGFVPAVRRGRTVLLATNRLEALDYADEILVMEEGRCVTGKVAREVASSSALQWCGAAPPDPDRLCEERRDLVRAVRRATLRRGRDEEPQVSLRAGHGSHFLAEVPAEAGWCAGRRRRRVIRQRSSPHPAAHRPSTLRAQAQEVTRGVRGLRRAVSADTSRPTLARDASVLRRLFPPLQRNTAEQYETEEITDEEAIEAGEETCMVSGSNMENDSKNPRGSVLWIYACECGFWTVLYLCSAFVSQSIAVAADYSLGWQPTDLSGYLALCCGTICFSGAGQVTSSVGSARARRRLHDALLDRTLRLPLRLFDSAPLGHTLNRFSADVLVLDKKIIGAIQRTCHFVLLCAFALLVNVIVFPWILCFAVPVCLFYYGVQDLYRRTARELQRLDASSQSPVVSQYAEAREGAVVIRAARLQARYTAQLTTVLDRNLNAFIALNSANRWLGIALDYLGASLVFISSTFAVAFASPPEMSGLAITYAMLLPTYLAWLVKYYSDAELYLGAVERILDQIRLPVEDYRENEETNLRSSWPEQGDIVFEKMSAGYGPVNILHDINLNIPVGQKVAICGRTGSGKSTLVLCCVGATEIRSGSVSVCGVSLSQAPLHRVRRRLVLLPQDVVLFSGSLRENLDPMGVHSDSEIWEVLSALSLDRMVASHPAGLESGVRGWSCGARSCAAAARALLAAKGGSAAALLLDEPAASLDLAAERKLLNAARTLAPNLTLMTVAHRVSSVLDFDRVLVISEGRVIEDGLPMELASKPDSKFAHMLRSSHC